MANKHLAKASAIYANELVYQDSNASEKTPKEKNEMAKKISKEMYDILTRAMDKYDETVFDRFGIESY